MYVFFKLDLDQPGCGGYAGLSAISANSLTDQDISQGWPWSGTGALGTELSTGKPRGQGLEQVEMEHHNTNLNTNRQSVQICTFFDVYIFRFIKKKSQTFPSLEFNMRVREQMFTICHSTQHLYSWSTLNCIFFF